MIYEMIQWFNRLPWDAILKMATIVYSVIAVIVCLVILMTARTGSKALAYLALIALVPVLGIIFYLSFGINYRKNKIYTRKILQDDCLAVLGESTNKGIEVVQK